MMMFKKAKKEANGITASARVHKGPMHGFGQFFRVKIDDFLRAAA